MVQQVGRSLRTMKGNEFKGALLQRFAGEMKIANGRK
jgi:hypothetical protein